METSDTEAKTALIRQVLSPARRSDGLFIQPKEVGPERELVEGHNRHRGAEHFKYADSDEGNPRTYDPEGNYNCGRCNMAQGETCLLVKSVSGPGPLKIDRKAGSCGDWENTCAGDTEMTLNIKSVQASVYGVAANGVGFGCHRCPYASMAYAVDSRGRSLYCGKLDCRVFPTACCALNGARTLPLSSSPTPPKVKSLFGADDDGDEDDY